MNSSNIEEILKLFDTKLIIGFGDRKESSKDIDILIISDEFDGISVFKRRDIIKRIDKCLDPICLTVKQFTQLRNSNSSLYNCIKKTQTLLYGDKTAFF